MSQDQALPVTSFPYVDTFTVASIPMPGKWTLTSAQRQFGWQVQQGYGLDGAFVIPTGNKLVVAKFRGEFWAPAQFAIYKEVRKRLLDRGVLTVGGLAAALGIHHPELKALGVANVVVLEVNPVIDQGGGHWTTTVDFLQYRPPLLALPKPALVIPDVPVPINPALANMRIEADRLKVERAALVGGK